MSESVVEFSLPVIKKVDPKSLVERERVPLPIEGEDEQHWVYKPTLEQLILVSRVSSRALSDDDKRDEVFRFLSKVTEERTYDLLLDMFGDPAYQFGLQELLDLVTGVLEHFNTEYEQEVKSASNRAQRRAR